MTRSEFVNCWYLREFDFLPEQCNMWAEVVSNRFLKHIEKFKIFATKEEAIDASKKVRELFGMPNDVFNT